MKLPREVLVGQEMYYCADEERGWVWLSDEGHEAEVSGEVSRLLDHIVVLEEEAGENEFCGCCGRELDTFHLWWCGRCTRHVSAIGSMSDRTYFSQTGEACPHQIGGANE